MASWQVDIPGLSQLVMNVGANGLKQLALSGVDIHTIGCMLMVAEMIPASQEFRQELNSRRKKQRTERRWLYNLVEIGAGSSFLVDQFLKTRAGENVLALMISVVPLLPENACPVVLGGLFEAAGVSADQTPGVNQFLKLRDGLLTFSRNVGFQERVLRYHALLERLVTPEGKPPFGRDPYDAMPAEQEIPRIIQLCHKVATSTSTIVLFYKGFHGSAWVAAFGSYILGLPVCALDNSRRQVPISNDYSNAKIILEPSAGSGCCELLTAGELSDFVRVGRLDMGPSRKGWLVNCNDINFLSVNHPELKDPGLVDAISDFVAIRTMNQVLEMVQSFEKTDCSLGRPIEDKLSFGAEKIEAFVSYLRHVLPQIRERSLDSLALLGFRVKNLSHFRFASDSRCQGTHGGPNLEKLDGIKGQWILEEAADEEKVFTRYMEQRGKTMWTESLGQDYKDWAQPWKILLCKNMIRAVLFASNLAFTDWSSRLQTMSADYFYGRCFFGFPSVTSDPLQSLAFAVIASTGLTEGSALNQQLDLRDWLALDLDGIVVLRNLATCQSIPRADGKLYSFSLGQIIFEEQRRQTVRMDYSDDDRTPTRIHITPPTSFPDVGNLVPGLQIRLFFTGRRDNLLVRHEVFNDGNWLTVANPIIISQIIPRLLVTKPCRHPYDSPYQSSHLPMLISGFMNYHDLRLHERIGYQQVDRNELGQWLACEWTLMSRNPIEPENLRIFLQKDTCINCTVSRIQRAWSKGQLGKIGIIAGRDDYSH